MKYKLISEDNYSDFLECYRQLNCNTFDFHSMSFYKFKNNYHGILIYENGLIKYYILEYSKNKRESILILPRDFKSLFDILRNHLNLFISDYSIHQKIYMYIDNADLLHLMIDLGFEKEVEVKKMFSKNLILDTYRYISRDTDSQIIDINEASFDLFNNNKKEDYFTDCDSVPLSYSTSLSYIKSRSIGYIGGVGLIRDDEIKIFLEAIKRTSSVLIFKGCLHNYNPNNNLIGILMYQIINNRSLYNHSIVINIENAKLKEIKILEKLGFLKGPLIYKMYINKETDYIESDFKIIS